MKKILLVCSSGMSTSMLVEKMKESAISQGIEVLIDATAESEVEKFGDVDIVLLGPQIGHMEDELRAILPMPVLTINMMDYGMMDGEKVLNTALSNI
ncbi:MULTISPECIES: PTS sugar transporter subunit IIB [unclassified Paenibacillus]|uniref:PTS sugar transporter subunit IIB n=1 Tax=unclassified Paenibacillus TaxID=185978 RepID=UPI0024B96EE8|nr:MULTISPECIES: PTS sugar transporter subunit IIB [unclassified Paenibacillus]